MVGTASKRVFVSGTRGVISSNGGVEASGSHCVALGNASRNVSNARFEEAARACLEVVLTETCARVSTSQSSSNPSVRTVGRGTG